MHMQIITVGRGFGVLELGRQEMVHCRNSIMKGCIWRPFSEIQENLFRFVVRVNAGM